MEANFSEIADRFQQIIQKMRKEKPTPWNGITAGIDSKTGTDETANH